METDKHKRDNFLKPLKDALQRGELVVFVGAGVSTSAGVPTWENLRQSLEEIDALSESETKVSRGIFGNIGKRKLLSALEEVRNKVNVSRTHRELCALPLRCIVTTNYDRLLEEACISNQKRPSCAFTPWDILQEQPAKPADVTVVKLHGDLSCPETLFFSKRDEVMPEMGTLLLREVERRWASTVQLFIGFSAEDPLLKGVLDELKKLDPNNRTQRFFVFPRQERHQRNRSMHSGKHVRYCSEDDLSELFHHLRVGLRANSGDPEINNQIAGIVANYKDYLSRLTRFGWTVHPSRKLDVREVLPRFNECAWTKALLLTSKQQADDSALALDSSNWSILLHILDVSKRTLLTGPPGSGKSTSLKLLAYRLATSTDVTLPLPVLITAREIQRLPDKTFLSIIDWVEKSSAIGGISSSVRSLCAKGRVLLILDGFDELNAHELSDLMAALRQFTSAYPDSGWIGSCRTHGFQDLIQSETDKVFSLCPLSAKDIQRFAIYWIPEFRRAQEFTLMVQSSQVMSFLASRPLFLSLLAQLWESNNHIPITPFKLYDAAVDTLLGRWDVERAVFRSGRYDAGTKRRFLWRWALFCGITDTYSHTIAAFYEMISYIPEWENFRLSEMSQLCAEIESSTGLLTQVGDLWSFSHRLFADFFAAQAILNLPVDEVRRAIVGSKNPMAWLPALELASSDQSDIEAKGRIKFVLKQCSRAIAKFAEKPTAQEKRAKKKPKSRQ